MKFDAVAGTTDTQAMILDGYMIRVGSDGTRLGGGWNDRALFQFWWYLCWWLVWRGWWRFWFIFLWGFPLTIECVIPVLGLLALCLQRSRGQVTRGCRNRRGRGTHLGGLRGEGACDDDEEGKAFDRYHFLDYDGFAKR